MKVYPPIPCYKIESFGEKQLFNFFTSTTLSDDYKVYHSLMIQEHQTNHTGEADFLVLGPYGILIIEVKGGEISIEDRTWYTKKRTGEVKGIESPISQAKKNMYSILNNLDKAGISFDRRKYIYGYGVIFSDTANFDVVSPEIKRSLILDQSELFAENDVIKQYITGLESYWLSKNQQSKNNAKIPGELKRKLVRYFNPHFEPLRSLRNEKEMQDRQRISLKDNQYNVIKYINEKSRTILSGSAGTGKTILGLEYFRKKYTDGNKAFVVPNEIFKNRLLSSGYKDVLTIEEIAELDADFLNFVVVDESHDYMCELLLEVLDRVLIGGVSEGAWMLLIDESNQKGIENNFNYDVYDLFLTYATYKPDPLDINIRNTTKIIDYVRQHTGRHIGDGGFMREGPKCASLQYHSDEELYEKLIAKVDAFINEDLPHGDILILGRSDKKSSRMCKLLSNHNYKVKSINEDNVHTLPFKNYIAYSSIRDFKGLESFIVIFDYGEFDSNELLCDEVYVALTRAVSTLIIFYPRSLSKYMAAMCAENFIR